VLDVRDVRKSFDGFEAVGGVSFTVPRGSISAIIGPNGAGKTTLFNLITGHLAPIEKLLSSVKYSISPFVEFSLKISTRSLFFTVSKFLNSVK
jgi:ABC-type branched-subunit amino acid transport system ATPase component